MCINMYTTTYVHTLYNKQENKRKQIYPKINNN